MASMMIGSRTMNKKTFMTVNINRTVFKVILKL